MGVFLSSPCLQSWLRPNHQPRVCSWERNKKKKNRIKPQQPVECFLAPESSNTSLPWLALAASSSQRGFLSSRSQLDFGQRLGVRGMCLTTADGNFHLVPFASCTTSTFARPCCTTAVSPQAVWGLLCAQTWRFALSSRFGAVLSPLSHLSHGHKSRADDVLIARNPERFVQPLHPKSAQNPSENKPCCAPGHRPRSKRIMNTE